MKLINPETGEKHEMDRAAFDELRAALKKAVEQQRKELVFRAMRLTTQEAINILSADV